MARLLYDEADILLLDHYFDDGEPDRIIRNYDKYCDALKDKLMIVTTKRIYYLKPEDKIIIM